MKTHALLLALVLAPIASLHANTPQEELDQEYNSQSGTAIHIVFDDSGSMADNHKIEDAKQAFDQWLSGIPVDTKISLTAINAGRLAQLEPANRDKVRNAVNLLRANGRTPLAKTIKEAANEIVQRRKEVTPYERHIILVVTDGEDTDVGPAETAKLVSNISNQLSVETVSIGLGGAGNYLKGASGKYFDANDRKSLLNALSQVNSEVDSTTEPVVSEEIAKRMEQMASTPKPTATASPAGTVAPSQQPQNPPQKKGFFQKLFGY